MPREASGNVYEKRGRWYARIRLAGERTLVPLTACARVEQAEARKVILLDLAARLPAAGVALETAKRLVLLAGECDAAGLPDVLGAADALCKGEARPKQAPAAPLPSGPTFRELGDRWISGELARQYPDHVKVKRSGETDRYRLERHVYPVIGSTPIAAFTLDDAEKVMRKVPAELSMASRRHVAQLMVRLVSLAVFPLRALKSNPLPKGFLPKLGAPKALPYLYPDEDRKLLGCTKIPLCWRVLYGFLDREGPRRSEAYGLTVADFNLDRGMITLDKNKTDDPRAWALLPADVRALRAWVALREGAAGERLPASAPMFVNEGGGPIREEHLAARFRAHLKIAGIDRPELHKNTAERKQIRVHDLRGTFVTLALANGKTETWVMDRTGHKSSQMIAKYRRGARTEIEVGLGDLAPLDVAIPELAAAPAASGGGGLEGATPRATGAASEPNGARSTPKSPRRTAGSARVAGRSSGFRFQWGNSCKGSSPFLRTV
jgi:integrase